MIFFSEGLKFYEKNIPFDAVSRPYGEKRAIIGIVSYENRDHLLRSLKTATGLLHFDYQFNKINGVGKNEGINFPDIKIPSTKSYYQKIFSQLKFICGQKLDNYFHSLEQEKLF